MVQAAYSGRQGLFQCAPFIRETSSDRLSSGIEQAARQGLADCTRVKSFCPVMRVVIFVPGVLPNHWFVRNRVGNRPVCSKWAARYAPAGTGV